MLTVPRGGQDFQKTCYVQSRSGDAVTSQENRRDACSTLALPFKSKSLVLEHRRDAYDTLDSVTCDGPCGNCGRDLHKRSQTSRMVCDGSSPWTFDVPGSDFCLLTSKGVPPVFSLSQCPEQRKSPMNPEPGTRNLEPARRDAERSRLRRRAQ